MCSVPYFWPKMLNYTTFEYREMPLCPSKLVVILTDKLSSSDSCIIEIQYNYNITITRLCIQCHQNSTIVCWSWEATYNIRTPQWCAGFEKLHTTSEVHNGVLALWSYIQHQNSTMVWLALICYIQHQNSTLVWLALICYIQHQNSTMVCWLWEATYNIRTPQWCAGFEKLHTTSELHNGVLALRCYIQHQNSTMVWLVLRSYIENQNSTMVAGFVKLHNTSELNTGVTGFDMLHTTSELHNGMLALRCYIQHQNSTMVCWFWESTYNIRTLQWCASFEKQWCDWHSEATYNIITPQ